MEAFSAIIIIIIIKVNAMIELKKKKNIYTFLCFEKNKNKLKQTLEEVENKSPEVYPKTENTAHYDAVLKNKNK